MHAVIHGPSRRPAIREQSIVAVQEDLDAMQENLEMDRWFYRQSDGKRGPVTTDQLLEMLRSRVISSEAAVWRDGMEAWTPAAEVPDLLAAGFSPSTAIPAPCLGRRRPRVLSIIIVLACMSLVAAAAAIARPQKPPVRVPESLQEELVVIGRSANIDSMPRVIDAIDDPDAAIASTAVAVAEAILGVRYSAADKANPRDLAAKIRADWATTREQLIRRNVAKGSLTP